MTTNQASIDRLKQVKQIPLIPWLEKNGYKLENTGNYVRCYSPFRNEGNASFDISLRRPDKWRDRGNGKHGDLLDLVMAITGKTHREAIDFLLGEENKNLPKFEPIVREKDSIEIVDNRPIRCNYLVSYLSERKIPMFVAETYLTEIEIRFPYGRYPERTSTVLGFKNDSNGYEMRNKFLKVCNHPKNVTTLGDGDGICVFEGFFSFLSYCTKRMGGDMPKCVILNSLSFLPQMLSFWDKNTFIYSYLDNDQAGDKATQSIKDAGFEMLDMRYIYTDYNDLNDQLTGKKLKKIKSIKELLQ